MVSALVTARDFKGIYGVQLREIAKKKEKLFRRFRVQADLANVCTYIAEEKEESKNVEYAIAMYKSKYCNL